MLCRQAAPRASRSLSSLTLCAGGFRRRDRREVRPLCGILGILQLLDPSIAIDVAHFSRGSISQPRCRGGGTHSVHKTRGGRVTLYLRESRSGAGAIARQARCTCPRDRRNAGAAGARSRGFGRAIAVEMLSRQGEERTCPSVSFLGHDQKTGRGFLQATAVEAKGRLAVYLRNDGAPGGWIDRRRRRRHGADTPGVREHLGGGGGRRRQAR